MNEGRARILVIADTDAARYAMVRTLRSERHEVLEGATGRAALEMARAEQPDLLVLDVRLPDILGFGVAEQLRADRATKGIAILQISASFTAADAQAQGLRRGADAYLTHPIEPQVLLATVAALLRMRAAERRAESECRRAEASERQYRFLADMVPHLIWSADANGRPDYFNQRWFEFSGHSKDANQTVDWAQSLHPDDRPRFAAAWERARATGEPLEIECRRFCPPAHAFRWLLVRSLPMKDETGAVVRWFGSSTDIEAHKQAQAERDRLLEQAQAAAVERDKLVEQLRDDARRKNEFLAMLSHELRNPLAPIRNSLYVLAHATSGGDQARHAWEVIERQSQQMTRLVDDLLDITRIARGKIRLQREPVELNGLVRRVAEDHRELLRRAGLELAVAVPEQPLRVSGDSARLLQVVGNLLQNSAKFTPAGGKVTLTLALEPPHEAVVRVRDTGAGITPETLPCLFEPFVQGERTLDRTNGGLGLGLALAHGIVELHGGAISAASQGLGRGAEFTVRLPLDTEGAPVLRLVRANDAPAGRRRVLIIEDLPDAAESLQEALGLAGHDVAVAYDGPTGVALARSFRPDVVLCDIGLPVMDGFQVARELRQDPALASAFLVALSGYALQEDIDKAREAGFDQHMAKPPRLEALERLLAGPSPRSIGV